MILYRKYQTGAELQEDIGSAEVINEIMTDFGGNRETYNELADVIATHESKYIKDGQYVYMDPTVKQRGGGPGRGLYQFEEGRHKGGITAVNRTYNYLISKNMSVPKWLQDAYALESFDASTVDADKQKMLFLGYHRMGPSKLSDYVRGGITLIDFWSKYHQTSQDKKKEENFKKDYELYLTRK